MSSINLVFVLFFGSLIFIKADKLQVSLYYEALCPDSINFVTTQLYPHFQDVGDYLNLDLVPFGFATADNSTGHWEFTCQHGPRECYNNKVQTCAIVLNSISSSLNFINCVMVAPSTSNGTIKTCAKSSGISWEVLLTCLTSGKADDWLAQNGVRTKAVKPPISYIPTIIFNGVYNDDLQWEAQKHFLKVVCELLKNEPNVCKYLGVKYNYIV